MVGREPSPYFFCFLSSVGCPCIPFSLFQYFIPSSSAEEEDEGGGAGSSSINVSFVSTLGGLPPSPPVFQSFHSREFINWNYCHIPYYYSWENSTLARSLPLVVHGRKEGKDSRAQAPLCQLSSPQTTQSNQVQSGMRHLRWVNESNLAFDNTRRLVLHCQNSERNFQVPIVSGPSSMCASKSHKEQDWFAKFGQSKHNWTKGPQMISRRFYPNDASFWENFYHAVTILNVLQKTASFRVRGAMINFNRKHN